MRCYKALRFGSRARPAPAAVVLLFGLIQDAVEGGFRCQVHPFIGEVGHDLSRRQIGEAWFMANVQQLLSFLGSSALSLRAAGVGLVSFSVASGHSPRTAFTIDNRFYQ
jgi:hypothetical protein